MAYAGTVSTYNAEFPSLKQGHYQLEVLAADAANANFGHVVQSLTVEP